MESIPTLYRALFLDSFFDQFRDEFLLYNKFRDIKSDSNENRINYVTYVFIK